MSALRLQKLLAERGVASRRHAEDMIRAGRVTVNGVAVTEMGTQADPDDDVRVDGAPIPKQERPRYVLYNKPVGEVSTVTDPQGRPTVLDRFAEFPARLYPVGRLDFDSEGLMLLTNDGALAERMMHPSHEIEKSYLARVTGQMEPEALDKLRRGVWIEGRVTAPARVDIIKTEHFATLVMVTIHEGRNRQVRRMMEAVGTRVLALQRVRIGSLRLGALAPGQWRELSEAEVQALRREAGL